MGDEFAIPDEFALSTDATCLLMATPAPHGLAPKWHKPLTANATVWRYIKQLPSAAENSEAATVRLGRFVDFLEHPLDMIARDAFEEVQQAQYEVLRAVGPRVPRAKLWNWIGDEHVPLSRTGLYAVILGMHQRAEDAAPLKQLFLDRKKYSRWVASYMAAYLMLTEETGLSFIDKAILAKRPAVATEPKPETNSTLPFSYPAAAIGALRFMHEKEPNRISKERIQQSLRLLLDRPDWADLAIVALTRMEDWTLHGRLMAMYDLEEFNVHGTKRAIVHYLHYCSQPSGGETASLRAEASRHLETLKVKDPQGVRKAIRFMFR